MKRAQWPFDECHQFEELTSAVKLNEVEYGPVPWHGFSLPTPPPVPTMGLLGNARLADLGNPIKLAEKLRDRRLATVWQNVRAHPIYRRLNRDENFKAALKVFRGKQRAKSSNGYKDQYAELRFLNIVASIVGMQSRHPDVRPKQPSLEDVERADDCAIRLLALMAEGVRLSDWSDHDQLKSLLMALSEKLRRERLANRTRKPRADELTPQRWYVDGLIGTLYSTFHEASPKIVGNIAAMMGYDMDPSTIDRRIAAVKKRRKDEAVDRVARGYPPKDTS